MKKLLSMIGAMTLIGTASTSVLACSGGENSTLKDTRVDISNKITSTINLDQLSENTAAEFLAKLQAKLIKITNLDTIKTSDYDVYKSGTTNAIQDTDITAGSSLNIKIVAKGNKFKGNKDNIAVNYTLKDTRVDISNKITSTINLDQLSENTAAEFLAKLQAKLIKITNLDTIKTSDYDVYKSGTTNAIQDTDITAGSSLNIKIVAKGNKFKGNKDNIAVNYTLKDTRVDISNKITSTINLDQLSENTAAEFLAKLQAKLIKITNLDTIKTSDYDVYKSGTTNAIQDTDITAGSSLNIKIVAKGNKFKGNKDNIAVNYTLKDTRVDISNKITSTINLDQLSENTAAEFLAKLQAKLIKITNLDTIKTSDYDVYKSGTTNAIQDTDITAGSSLNIKIVAKGNKFKGNKDNIATNYNQKDDRTDIKSITQLTGLNLKSDPKKIFEDFASEIFEADQLKDKSKDDMVILYYNQKENDNIINNNKQEKGIFFIKIIVLKQNDDWKMGSSDYIEITIS